MGYGDLIGELVVGSREVYGGGFDDGFIYSRGKWYLRHLPYQHVIFII